MVQQVKTHGQRFVGLAAAGCFLLCGAASLWGDVKANPYLPIVDRNAFGLKPIPPPPPPDTSSQAEKKPPVQVKLTGITSILSKTKALVEITEGPGKPAKKPILAEGESLDNVEVVSIDVKKNTVTFKIGEVVTNMTFEVAKASTGPTPGAPTPGVPGVPPVIPGRPAVPGAPPMASTPTVIGGDNSGGGSGRSGVIVVGNSGASTASPAAPVAAAMPMTFGASGVSGGMPPSGNVTVSDGSASLRTIPSRVPRATALQPGQPSAVDPAVQYLNLKISEEVAKQKGIPHPPTPPIPGLE